MNAAMQEWARTLDHYSAARRRLGGIVGSRPPLPAARKLPSPPRKYRYKLEGGPLDGRRIPLSEGTTMRFRLRGEAGRYACATVAGRSWTGIAKWVSD